MRPLAEILRPPSEPLRRRLASWAFSSCAGCGLVLLVFTGLGIARGVFVPAHPLLAGLSIVLAVLWVVGSLWIADAMQTRRPVAWPAAVVLGILPVVPSLTLWGDALLPPMLAALGLVAMLAVRRDLDRPRSDGDDG